MRSLGLKHIMRPLGLKHIMRPLGLKDRKMNKFYINEVFRTQTHNEAFRTQKQGYESIFNSMNTR